MSSILDFNPIRDFRPALTKVFFSKLCHQQLTESMTYHNVRSKEFIIQLTTLQFVNFYKLADLDLGFGIFYDQPVNPL
jgi:hypothetical protein